MKNKKGKTLLSLQSDLNMAADLILLKKYKEALKKFSQNCKKCAKSCEFYFDCPNKKD